MSGAPPPGSPPRRPLGLSLRIKDSPASEKKGEPNPGVDLPDGYILTPLARSYKSQIYSMKKSDGSTVGIRKYVHSSNRRVRNTHMIPEIQNYKYISSQPGYENYVLPILRTSTPTIEMTDFYIDFPYVNGVDLEKYFLEIYQAKEASGTDMKDEATKRLLCNIFADVAESILFLHSIGVRHNDIKLDNIFTVMNPDGSFTRAVLFDFDVSERMDPASPAIVDIDYTMYLQLFSDILTVYCGIPLPPALPKEVENIEHERAVLSELIGYLRGGAAAGGGKRRYSRAKKTRTRRYRKTLKAAARNP
jgi:serine/threonine protein kinase